MTPVRKPQVRIRWSKLGKVRFTSHRDMARIWERAVRRAQLPIAYSEGFSPRAKMSYGLALPTVFESLSEFVDLTLEETVDVDGLAGLLNPAVPVGVEVTGAVKLEGKVASLQEVVDASVWSMFVKADRAELDEWAAGLLAASELVVERERKGKIRTDDVRPAIVDIELRDVTDERISADVEVHVQLASKTRAVRPLELLAINQPSIEFVLGRRVHQFIAPIGARQDPLSVGAAEAPRSLSCVS